MSSSSFRIEDDPVWSLCPARRVVNVGCIGFASASKSCFAIDICFQEGYFLDCDTQSVGCHDMTSTKRRHVSNVGAPLHTTLVVLGQLARMGQHKAAMLRHSGLRWAGAADFGRELFDCFNQIMLPVNRLVSRK